MKCYHSELHTKYVHCVCVYYIYISSQKPSKSGLALRNDAQLDSNLTNVYISIPIVHHHWCKTSVLYLQLLCGEFALCIITAEKLQITHRPQSLRKKSVFGFGQQVSPEVFSASQNEPFQLRMARWAFTQGTMRSSGNSTTSNFNVKCVFSIYFVLSKLPECR